MSQRKRIQKRGPFQGVRVGPGAGPRARRILGDLLTEDMLGGGLKLDEHGRLTLDVEYPLSVESPLKLLLDADTLGLQTVSKKLEVLDSKIAAIAIEAVTGTPALAGDMQKSVYDTDYDGIVEEADTVTDDGITTAKIAALQVTGAKIATNTITADKFSQISTARFLGRHSVGTGDVQGFRISDVDEQATPVGADLLALEQVSDTRLKRVKLENLLGAMDFDRNGFPNRTDSTMSFTDGTRTFEIAPAVTSFYYYDDGVKYTVSAADDIVISDVAGIHVIYYDGATLSEAVNPSDGDVDTVIREHAIISIIYWNATEGEGIYLGEERHGFRTPPELHAYLHFYEGLRIRSSGFGLNTLAVDENGSLDAHAQFGIDAGGASDEDLYRMVSAVPSTTGTPIYHMIGASAEWNRTINAGFSVRTYDNTSGTRLCYNEYTGGAWQLTEVTDGKYTLAHTFVTSEKDTPCITIMGQAEYATKSAARTGAETEVRSLVLNSTLAPEIHALSTTIHQSKTSYGNAVNDRIISTEEGDTYIDWRSETISRLEFSTTDHSALTNLGADDHTDYHTDARADTWFTGKDLADLGTKSHTSLTDIGTNTHAQIDTHLASTANPHSVTATQITAEAIEAIVSHDLVQDFEAGEHRTINDAGTGATDLLSAQKIIAAYAPIAEGVTNGDSHDHAGGDGAQVDHGGLAGLSDDDHSQYYNEARGDARYYTQSEVDALTWDGSDIVSGKIANTYLNTGTGNGLDADTVDGEEASAIVTTARVNAAGAVMETDFSTGSLLSKNTFGAMAVIGYSGANKLFGIFGADINPTFYDIGTTTLFGRNTGASGSLAMSEVVGMLLGEQSGTSFPGSPTDGQRYYHETHDLWFTYSAADSGWLGDGWVTLTGLFIGNRAATNPLYWGEAGGGVLFSTAGPKYGYAFKLKELHAQVFASSTCTFSVYDDGAAVTGGTISLSSATTAYDIALTSATIATGSKLGIYVTAGTAGTGSFVIAKFKRFET